MPIITKQQALFRWDTLPMNLREAIFSERNAEILWQICELQHLPEDRIYRVATLAGDVIMGFIHPEDLAREIQESVGLKFEVAEIIANEIIKKIFAPIRSDIDKIYSPIVEVPETFEEEEKKEEAETLVITGAPKVDSVLKAKEPEPFKIIVTEGGEELIVPGTGGEGAEAEGALAISEGPTIIQKGLELETAVGAKKPLSGLFSFLRAKKEEEAGAGAAGAAQIELGAVEPDMPVAPVSFVSAPEIILEAPIPANVGGIIPPLESPREVHYGEMKTPINSAGEELVSIQIPVSGGITSPSDKILIEEIKEATEERGKLEANSKVKKMNFVFREEEIPEDVVAVPQDEERKQKRGVLKKLAGFLSREKIRENGTVEIEEEIKQEIEIKPAEPKQSLFKRLFKRKAKKEIISEIEIPIKPVEAPIEKIQAEIELEPETEIIEETKKERFKFFKKIFSRKKPAEEIKEEESLELPIKIEEPKN